MQFFDSSRFVFLWLVPLVVLMVMWGSAERRRRLARLGHEAFLETRLMPEFSKIRKKIASLLLASVFFFSALALARPQWGEEKKRVERKGVDLLFLLDTSLSMLAEDIKPSRLAKSKLEMKNIIRRLRGDRVGMVAFAGSSFLQCPLTLDYSAFLLFVDALKPGYIPDPGTSLAHAIRLGFKAFPEESRKYRAIIVFSDGEDHEGGVPEALEEAKLAGVRIYTVGVGTTEGEPIPLRSAENQKMSGYKKDRKGEVVITRLNSSLLGQIAKETGGLYVPATAAGNEIDLVLKHLETLGERRLKERLIAEREDHFQLFLFIAFLFLMGETFLGNRKKGKTLKFALPILAFFVLTAFMDTPRSLVQKGNRLNKEKKYQSAVENYRKAEVAQPGEPVIRYNLGTSLYQLYEYRDAEKELEQALSHAKTPATKAKILYNYGNTQYRLGDFEKAIESYKKVLDLDPKDEDAKYNLEFLQKKKSQFEKKNEERQKQQQEKQPQQQQQQQKEQLQPQPQPEQKDQQGQREQQRPQPQPRQEKNEQAQGGEGKEEEKEGQGQRNKEQERQEQQSQQQEQQEEGQKKEREEKKQGTQEKKEEKQEEKQREEGRKEQTQQGESEGEALQGQMGKENALRILDTLQEEEKELQDLRRPPVHSESQEVLKDW